MIMETHHREIILSNIDTLKEWTAYDKLKDGCIDRKILSPEMVEQIEKNSDDISVRHEELLRKITKRGPDAFKELVIVCQSNNWDAADFLMSFEKSDGTQSNGCDNRPEMVNVERDGNLISMFKRTSIENNSLELYTESVEIEAVTITVKKAVKFCSQNILAYRMRSKNRGVLFLVNIIEINNEPGKYRNGAILDKAKLITLFRQFGFEIFYYENVSLSAFHHLVEELINSNYLRRTDCLVFCVLSHGCFKDGHQMIQFSDGRNGSIEDVITKFSNINCPNLMRKPKIFIFPMCRGISKKIKVKNFGAPNTHLKGQNIPAFSDIKICYGSVKGFETFRDRNVGSWYILAFCEILAEYAHLLHFDDLHKLIGQRLEYYCQSRSNDNEYFVQTISSEDLGFTQHLFFNPGYYG